MAPGACLSTFTGEILGKISKNVNIINSFVKKYAEIKFTIAV